MDSTLILRNAYQEDAGKDYKPFEPIFRVRLTGYNIMNAIFEPTYRFLFCVTDNGKILKFNIADSDAGGEDEDKSTKVHKLRTSSSIKKKYIHLSTPTRIQL